MTVSDQADAVSAKEMVAYETLDEGRIARIWLNRPDEHNAQNRTLLVQLDEAFSRAEADDTVRVVILAARGRNFSAGHDLGSDAALAERKPGPTQHPSFSSHGATLEPIVEKLYHQEWHYFFENTCRWRDLRKITIAQVQGNAISAGLMLIWACDLIVAADNAKFSDVVAVRLGMPGVEYYAHPWEFGPRKAKELLLTGDSLDADEAYRLGMVSKVFPVDELEEKTLEFAAAHRRAAHDGGAVDQGFGQRGLRRDGLHRGAAARVSCARVGSCPLGGAQREQIPGRPTARRRRLAHGQTDQGGPPRYAVDRADSY